MACGCVLFPQKGCIFIHDLAPYHNTKITRTSIECKGIPILDWPEKLPDKHSIANVWNIMQQEIVNQMPCKMEICESKYVMRGIRPERIQCQGESQMPLKQKNVQRNTDFTMLADKFVYVFFYGNAFTVCCCVFIGMHFIFIYKCCLMIYRNKMA